MNSFLLEIGTEELPAKQLTGVLNSLKDIVIKDLNSKEVAFDNVSILSTPRRIAILISGLPDKKDDTNEKVKGPAVVSAFDQDGKPTKALEGFLRSKGCTLNDITKETIKGVEYIYVNTFKKGEHSKDILTALCKKWIFDAPFAKSMRWRDYNITFARPIRWIVAMYNDEALNIEIEGVVSGTVSRGHRTLSSDNIQIKNADSYSTILKDAFVIADHNERKNIILSQIDALKSELNAEALLTDELLDEIVNLVEYPTAFVGEFDNVFLTLPKPVIVTPMRDHQRYIPLAGKDGKLLSKFIAVRNGNENHIETVKKGNEKVLRARLKDAQFFYAEDTKKPLESFVDSLKNVVYQVKLGTVYDKVLRIKELALYIADKIGLNVDDKKNLERAVMLCKADLNTSMVNEFDELQGLMGSEYARLSGENEAVCASIESHYYPRFAGDELPKDKLGTIISLADKLDSLVGSFGIGVQHTSNQDPFGLRRMTIGILNIISENDLNINFEELIRKSMDLLDSKITVSKSELFESITAFFKQRFRVILLDQGRRYDIVNSVMNVSGLCIPDVIKRIDTICSVADNEDFHTMSTSIKRIIKPSKKAETQLVDTGLFASEQESKLLDAVEKAENSFASDTNNLDYLSALQTLKPVCTAIDEMFDSVMIMCEDEKVCKNRLALLNKCYSMTKTICDFDEIVDTL